MSEAPVIRLRNICKEYPATDGSVLRVLDGLDLDVGAAQLVAIRGESGSGKSTLLRIMGLVDNNYSGSYSLAGRIIRNGDAVMPWSEQEELRAVSMGFIFQEDRLFEHLSVRSNIELPLKIHRLRDRAHRAQLAALLETVYRPKEIREEKILSRKRSKLSGGQRQRASILRALAHSPLLLLADEPTASLDMALKEEIFEILSQLSKAGRTVVVVSHDEIFERADVVYELREGRLLECARRVRSAARRLEDGLNTSAAEAPATDSITSFLETAPEVVSNPCTEVVASGRGSGGLSRFKRLRSWSRSLLPRTSLGLQLSLAGRDLFRSWLFTLLALGALTTGAFQLTLLWSLEAGTHELLDDLIRKGSRLNRITVPVKPENLMAEQRFPDLARIRAIDGVVQVVPRREGIYRVQDRLGRDRFETVFGLERADPELEKLVFSAGSGFRSEEALEVLMSERSIQRLFEVPGQTVSDAFRQSLIGQKIWFAIARPPAGMTLATMSEDVALEVIPFQMTLVGIVAQAEADRNFYFPRTTQLLLERWRLDESRTFELPLNDTQSRWVLPAKELRKLAQFPWEERVHVYFANLDQVIPGHRQLTAMGYEARAEIFNYQWVIHTRKLANLVISGLVTLILLVAGMIIAGNIMIGVEMRFKEIVLLKLLGMRNGDITAIYVWNAIMAAVIGTLIGFGAGTAMVGYLRDFVREHYPSAEFSRLLGETSPFAGGAVLIGLTLALVFSVLPAYKAGRTDPVRGFGV